MYYLGGGGGQGVCWPPSQIIPPPLPTPMRIYASVVLFYIFSILLSMNCHSDYNTIDGRIAGSRRPYPDIFQRSIKSPRVHELCRTYFVVQA